MELEGFCRGCLVKYDDPSELIQYSEKNRRLYVYCTGLQVKRNDAFTFQLCKGCYTNMKLSCRFKKQCRATDKKFRQYTALKETGTNVDFCSFLKTNDDAFAFSYRLPLSGCSTPIYQKTRDDDNESTSTSIRNFMTDILPPDEIADTEARIIKEVIEEEADVLDDSLDSVWLQDDQLTNEDSRLDFSFSPFSTPKANDERFEAPQKLANHLEINGIKNLEINSIKENDLKIKNLVVEIVPLTENGEEINEKLPNIGFDDLKSPSKDVTTQNEETAEGLKGFYVENESVIKESGDKHDLTIEKNIEQSLKLIKTEYSLEELLNTPRHYPCNSGASTPTINNILFGENLPDLQTENITQKYQFKKEDDIELQLKAIFQDDSSRTDEQNEGRKSPESDENGLNSPEEGNIYENYNEKDSICYICDKQFKTLLGLKHHASSVHKHKIFPVHNGPKIISCQFCSKNISGYSNYRKHKMRVHSKQLKCTKCNIKFESEEELLNHNKYTVHKKQDIAKEIETEPGKTYKCNDCDAEFNKKKDCEKHMSIHESDEAVPERDENDRLKCDECGATFARIQNLIIHKKRHAQDFDFKCDTCLLAFPRKSDLNAHMKRHTGIKEFKCQTCNKMFARKDVLFRHKKLVHDPREKFPCTDCGITFLKKNLLVRHKKSSITCIRAQIRRNKKPQPPTVVENAVLWPNGLGLYN